MIIGNLQKNAINAQLVIKETVKRLNAKPPRSVAHSALQFAILTPPAQIPETAKTKLGLLIKKYL